MAYQYKIVEISQTSVVRPYAFWGIVLVFLVLAAIMLVPFVTAILWASVLSILLYPLYNRLRAKRSDNHAALSTVGITIAGIVIPLTLVVSLFFSQISAAIEDSPFNGRDSSAQTAYRTLDEKTMPILSKLGIRTTPSEYIEANKKEIQAALREPASRIAVSLGRGIFTLVVALLTMFFLLRDGPSLIKPVVELSPIQADRTLAILVRMRETVHAVFVGVVLVSMIQAALAAVLYFAVGAPSPIVWAVATLFACVIPLLGAPIVYGPLALYLMLQGEIARGVIVLLVGGLIISQIDNLLRPFFIGARTKLHPIAIFFSLLGGVLTFGPVGIMAGPVVLTLLLGLSDLARELNTGRPLPAQDEQPAS